MLRGTSAVDVDHRSWPTFQYMVSEVQYGGKITDNLDRRMFKTYTQARKPGKGMLDTDQD